MGANLQPIFGLGPGVVPGLLALILFVMGNPAWPPGTGPPKKHQEPQLGGGGVGQKPPLGGEGLWSLLSQLRPV